MRGEATAEDWLRAAEEQLTAAMVLSRDHVRASLGRAYYAAYSVCCACFEQHGLGKAVTADGDEWFAHRDVAILLLQLLDPDGLAARADWPEARVSELVRQVIGLQSKRTEADYKPQVPHTRADAEHACSEAAGVLAALRLLLE